MSILYVIIILAVIGFLVWLEETYIPMSQPWKMFIRIVAIIATVLWLLGVFGILNTVGSVRIN